MVGARHILHALAPRSGFLGPRRCPDTGTSSITPLNLLLVAALPAVLLLPVVVGLQESRRPRLADLGLRVPVGGWWSVVKAGVRLGVLLKAACVPVAVLAESLVAG